MALINISAWLGELADSGMQCQLLFLTADAKVTDFVVEHSASADFDAAAVEAVQNWARGRAGVDASDLIVVPEVSDN